jgi:hypothetical protein
MIFDPLHYLALLEHKSHALDQAAPLAGWQLPAEFGALRRQMEHDWASASGASMCRCCGCWKPSPWGKWPRPSARPYVFPRLSSMR